MDAPRRQASKPTALAIGSYRPGTGFSRVLQGILPALGALYDTHLLAPSYPGPQKLQGRVRIHPGDLRPEDPLGVNQAEVMVEELRPRLLFLYTELWLIRKYHSVFERMRRDGKIVVYCPVDGRISDASVVETFFEMDQLIVPTDCARDDVERCITSSGLPCSSVDAIPQGIDVESFYPLADKQRAKRIAFADRPDLWDSFVVFNGNLPNPRKRLDLTLDAFARFAEDKPPQVRLYIHHLMSGNRQFCDGLLETARNLGIEKRLLWRQGGRRFVDDATVNAIYNACEVGINTAAGEGWGLVSFEHAATGAPQIVPGHASCQELWGESAILLPVNRRYPAERIPLTFGEIEPRAAAEALERLYRSESSRARLGKAGFQEATRRDWQWPEVRRRWRQVFSLPID